MLTHRALLFGVLIGPEWMRYSLNWPAAFCRGLGTLCAGTDLSFSYYGFGSKRARRMSLAPGQLGQRSRKVAYRKLGRFTGTTSVRADRRGRLENYFPPMSRKG